MLRLLDAVLGGVFSARTAGNAVGEAGRRRELAQHVHQTAECARELELAGTEEAAKRLAALLTPDVGGDELRAQVEEQAERLQAEAERELEARMKAAAPAPAGPGMPWGDFALESREHLSNIERDLLRLENAPEDCEAVHALFRGFHTIKGLAAIAGTETAREIAHRTENLLDEVRSGSRLANSALIDLALASADFLGEVVTAAERIDRGEDAAIPEEAGALLERLSSAMCIETAPATAQPARNNAAGGPGVREGARSAVKVDTAERIDRGEEAAIPEDAGALLERLSSAMCIGTAAPAQPARNNPAGVPGVREGARSAVKVDTAKLDQLVDLVGELVIAQSLVQLDPALLGLGDPRTAKNLNQLGRITTELRKTAMSLRVVPVGQTFRRMARVFRDLVRKSNKMATLETAGEDAELDRTIVERLADPLMHMVRNAVDHGLELPADREKAGKPAEGRIRLTATHQSGHVVIEVSDDGRGLDHDRILSKAIERGLVKENAQLTRTAILELIFEPGFSTSEQVTAISGRGVGMDVVKREIERLRGRVEVRSEPGEGTTFLLRVPLTLAIIDALVVRHGEHQFILPLLAVREILKPGGQTISTVEGRHEVTLLRDRVVPVLRMEAALGENVAIRRDGRARTVEELMLVVVEAGARRVALAVDEVVGKQQVVIKSLGDWLGQVRGVAGGAILGDGSVGIILDLDGLMGKEGYGLAA
ncbi:MAG: chemotaxis protein CheA [Bryobacteraceae bacterium]